MKEYKIYPIISFLCITSFLQLMQKYIFVYRKSPAVLIPAISIADMLFCVPVKISKL